MWNREIWTWFRRFWSQSGPGFSPRPQLASDKQGYLRGLPHIFFVYQLRTTTSRNAKVECPLAEPPGFYCNNFSPELRHTNTKNTWRACSGWVCPTSQPKLRCSIRELRTNDLLDPFRPAAFVFFRSSAWCCCWDRTDEVDSLNTAKLTLKISQLAVL